ncbi:MAG TPA: hypothetical protein DCZ91_21240 [Lachnospiraceae bacterium]|nr:hypothetical protein [Lachnospiraceae bacterium]
MKKDNLTTIRDYIVKNSRFLFPVILIAVVAVTVSFALNAGNKKEDEKKQESLEEVSVQPDVQGLQEEATPEPQQAAPEDAVLAVNEDEAIHALIAQYYNAMASGDSTVMTAIYDEISENDLLRYEETAKYLSSIPAMDIYTKPGLEKGNTVVYVYYRLCFLNHEEQEIPGWQTFYVCDNGQGGLYIKNELNLTEEEKEYIVTVSAQDDVVEFNNRVSVEYNDLATEHPELLTYMGELGKQINATIGVRLAEQNAGAGSPEGGEQPAEGAPQEGEQPAEGTPQGEGQPADSDTPAENPEGGEGPAQSQAPEQPEAPSEMGPRYATATTTVNVRSSDSEQADKLGKVAGGDKVQVQEVRVNGWSKIVFEGGDGYIKSEYLHMEESAEGQQVIGTVTANENVRIRAAAAEDAAQLGLMVGGDSLELLANENGWCKVIYDGKVGYVKADYVTQQ